MGAGHPNQERVGTMIKLGENGTSQREYKKAVILRRIMSSLYFRHRTSATDGRRSVR